SKGNLNYLDTKYYIVKQMLQTQKILIIDDETALLKILSRFLQKLEIRSETAETGREGLKIFKENPTSFSYAFIDYNLPELSAKQIINEIRNLNPKIKVVLSSGYSVDEIRKELEPLDFDGTLQKPFTFTDLKNLLEKLKSN
ncbi:MAG: response regulator, partial [Promethearchaeota archaeon]